MFSKGKHPQIGQQPFGFQPKPPTQESTLHRAEVFIERKEFSMLLKENPRGRFLRIVESNGNRSASIIVPSTGLRVFHKLLCEMMDADTDIHEKGNAA